MGPLVASSPWTISIRELGSMTQNKQQQCTLAWAWKLGPGAAHLVGFLDALIPVVAEQASGQRLAGGQLRARGPAVQLQRNIVHVDELEASSACAPQKGPGFSQLPLVERQPMTPRCFTPLNARRTHLCGPTAAVTCLDRYNLALTRCTVPGRKYWQPISQNSRPEFTEPLRQSLVYPSTTSTARPPAGSSAPMALPNSDFFCSAGSAVGRRPEFRIWLVRAMVQLTRMSPMVARSMKYHEEYELCAFMACMHKLLLGREYYTDQVLASSSLQHYAGSTCG